MKFKAEINVMPLKELLDPHQRVLAPIAAFSGTRRADTSCRFMRLLSHEAGSPREIVVDDLIPQGDSFVGGQSLHQF